MTAVYRCRSCGGLGTIVEVSLVPRFFGVSPPDEIDDAPVPVGPDELWDESELVNGYACNGEESCAFWQGNYPEITPDPPGAYLRPGLTIEEIAEVVDDA